MVSPEEIEKHSEDIELLKREVRSLKTRIGKLTSRIDKLEIMNFQEQITSLSENINSLDKKALTISRFLARFELDFTQLHMLNAISASTHPIDSGKLREKIASKHSSSKEALKHSSEPLEILMEFHNECSKISAEYKLHAFTD